MNRRVYVPVPVDGRSDPPHVVTHCQGCERCTIDDGKNIAIYIDGACRGNGSPNAQAGIGVYIGPASTSNVSVPLKSGPQSSQRAEICAAIAALEHVKQLVLSKRICCAKGIVLLSDSTCLVDAVTDRIDKWSRNSWISSSGKPVVYKEDFLELERCINYLERNHFCVRFWRVGKKYNHWNGRLARAAVGL